MAAELHAGSRIVDSNPEFIAFCPFASRLPLETWILPRRHQASFSDCNDGQLELFAPLLQKLLGQLKLAAGDPPYNLVLYTAPLQQKVPALHWHCEILPRLTTLAGFEWGTGMYINPTPPELAARYLI
jgi:UDPglucose--hexose-1-phosphate uridylyltransferase